MIPCYNEAKRLDLAAFEEAILSSPDIDFLFCDDGSTDETGKLLTKFAASRPDRVSLRSLLRNGGKAEAVRSSMQIAFQSGRYSSVGFWDADLSTPLSEIPRFLSATDSSAKKMLIGSRLKRLGAVIERRKLRHYPGRVFATFTSLVLRLPVYDTQCGAKMFHADLQELFEEPFISRWLFDIEILARYRNKYGVAAALRGIAEIPVNSWKEKKGSKLKWWHLSTLPFQLFRIHYLYNISKKSTS